MCLYPDLVKNPKYKANKKNGGVIPAVTDKRTLYVPIACGNCLECRRSKARDYSIRLQEDIKEHKNGKFVTLTFSQKSLIELNEVLKKNEERQQRLNKKAKNGLSGYNHDNEIATIGVRRFLERWRKKYGKSVRHWLVTELGGKHTERIHLHGIIYTDYHKDIAKIWKYGYVYIGTYVNNKTINYIVKYVSKMDVKHPHYKSKVLATQGIGSGYLKSKAAKYNKYNGKNTKESYTTSTGTKLPLPLYYRNHIYTEEERNKLWIQKLDEQKRYVLGKEIDISQGEEKYYKVLHHAQKLSKKLKYGDRQKNWEKRKYENQRRNLKKLEQLQKRAEEFGTSRAQGQSAPLDRS